MNNFNDGAPTNPGQYLDLGCEITPCKDKRPILKEWSDTISDKDDFNSYTNIGLKMTGLSDIDADNHYVKRFAGKYLLSPGSTFGRKSNPSSHYIYFSYTGSGVFRPCKCVRPHADFSRTFNRFAFCCRIAGR